MALPAYRHNAGMAATIRRSKNVPLETLASSISFSTPVPLWVVVLVLLAFGAFYLRLSHRLREMARRLDDHAESIANMDDWADAVEHELTTSRRAGKQPQSGRQRAYLANYSSTVRTTRY